MLTETALLAGTMYYFINRTYRVGRKNWTILRSLQCSVILLNLCNEYLNVVRLEHQSFSRRRTEPDTECLPMSSYMGVADISIGPVFLAHPVRHVSMTC